MHRLWLIALLLVAGCASRPSDAVRVLVYNIHAGRDAAGTDNLERVASLIETERADLVLLQEVDRGTARSGGVDQLAELTRRTGMHGAFGKSLDYQGGLYGIAILSRWPIGSEEIVPLRVDPPQPRAGGAIEPRVAFAVDTSAVVVVNTHLDASRDDRYRLQETTGLLALFERRPPALVGGDLNAEPESAVHRRLTDAGLRDAWLECGRGNGLTFPASNPVKRIDYLFLASGYRCVSASVLESTASDHRPLLVEVEKPRPDP